MSDDTFWERTAGGVVQVL